LQALLGLGHGVAYYHVIDAARVERGHRLHEVLDNLGCQVIGTGETEDATRRFANGRAVAGHDICGISHNTRVGFF